jgi:O-antigen/teichoic acid export membrane protein
VLTLARLMMLTIAFLFFSDLMYSVLLGDQDFLFYNAMRLWQPAATTVAYVLLWAGGGLTVETAVAAMFVASLVDNVVVGTRVFGRHRLGPFDLRLAGRSLWYGVRAHGTAAGNLVTTRLDLMIIPAFLSASSVGLYATATTVSWLVVTVASSLAALVLPVAVRRGGTEGPATVVRALYATLLVGAAIAAVLALVAGVAVRLVYGASFAASVEPLRILLPGSVLYAGAGVLWSGLYAVDRPFTAALTQVAGVIVTVVGLLVFLEQGGIRAAALISTISYTLVFASALVAYRRAAGLSWGQLAPPTSLARAWWRQASRVVISRA